MDTRTQPNLQLPLLEATNLVSSTSGPRKVRYALVFGDDSWVIAFTGLRGSGKSLSMAWAIAHCLMKGLKVWSNMTVAFNCRYPGGEIKSLTTLPLDFNALYLLDKSISGGVVAIDELQYYLDSRQSGSVRARLLNATIRQVRKRTLSFLYTTRDLAWIDKRLRFWETDIEFKCWDLFRSYPAKFRKGESIHQALFDHSGAWTGHPWYPGMPPTSVERLKACHLFWPIYQTDFVIDYFEASQRVEVDTGPRVISDRPSKNQINIDSVRDVAISFKLQNKQDVPAGLLRGILMRDYGINIEDRLLGKMLGSIGAVPHRTRAGTFYNLDALELPA